MSNLKPPKGYKHDLSDQACHDMAERALRSSLGQEALRQGWGRGLYRYVMAWGSTPTMPETKAALHRQANDFQWDLIEMRKVEKPDDLNKALLRLAESAESREAELRDRYLRRSEEI